ncbi:MAG: GspH/FimT family pseudopilin [Pseudomonadota bacterium]
MRRHCKTGQSSSRGFTIIEVVTTVSVLSVLLALGAPAFSDMISGNRMLSEAYSLRGTLDGARSEALTRGSFVTVCRSSNGTSCSGNWSSGFIAFVDVNGDSVVDGGDEIIAAHEPEFNGLVVLFSNAQNRVRFDSRGNALGFDGTFTFCDDRGDSAALGVTIASVGTVAAAVDTDAPADNIRDDLSGSNLSCSA